MKNLVGLDERSATGMGADVGVLVVSVPQATSPGQAIVVGVHHQQQDTTLTITR